MTELDEYLDFRNSLLDDSKDENGFVSQSILLSQSMPSLLDAKLVDSEDYNESYYYDESENLKINGYAVNESQERLQLFIIDEDSISDSSDTIIDDIAVSNRADYEYQFKRVERFVKKAFKGQLLNSIQDSDNVKALASHLESSQGFRQFDVVEVFLISLSPTVSFKGDLPQPKPMYFQDETLKRSCQIDGGRHDKEIILIKKLVDLNFLFNVMVSKGYREVLTINFNKTFGYEIEVIKAADEKNFESYLCVLKADVLADLYKRYSSRLLEKNVRSFLQFRGVNKGIRETIRKEPEKFIAYNNGLTITATNAKVFERKKHLYIEELSDFQIVNGGQTTASIFFSKKDGIDVSKVNVMAKINIAKQTDDNELEQLINNISKYSNAQSRVSKVDLKSRNPQLVKIKQLSESVLTPSGSKWFFERSKGEFNTMVKKAGRNAQRIKNEFPTKKRFSKEQLAKYFSAWGDEPYLVKKGGEKIFRHFIEVMSPEDADKTPRIDRGYYEDIISRIMMFRELESLYGQGKNAMGQIRSAVVPYSLSVFYTYTDSSGRKFDMLKIWKQEGLDIDLSVFFENLMKLMNELIKQYSASDDYGEYSKKPQLWESIKESPEIKHFMEHTQSINILEKYSK
jgi:hypothetical protein